MPLPRPSLTRRVASMLYEILLLLGILSVTFIVPHIAYGLATQSSAHPALVQIHFFAVVLLYFVWFGLNGGQTLAMKTWKLQLVSNDGRPLRPLQVVLRYMAAWPSVLLFGIGVLWALVDKDQQFLHDRLAGTQLVFERG